MTRWLDKCGNIFAGHRVSEIFFVSTAVKVCCNWSSEQSCHPHPQLCSIAIRKANHPRQHNPLQQDSEVNKCNIVWGLSLTCLCLSCVAVAYNFCWRCAKQRKKVTFRLWRLELKVFPHLNSICQDICLAKLSAEYKCKLRI